MDNLWVKFTVVTWVIWNFQLNDIGMLERLISFTIKSCQLKVKLYQVIRLNERMESRCLLVIMIKRSKGKRKLNSYKGMIANYEKLAIRGGRMEALSLLSWHHPKIIMTTTVRRNITDV